jgi:hypothetical protein
VANVYRREKYGLFRQQHQPDPDAYSASACSEIAEDKTKFNHSESEAIKGEEPLANTSSLRYNYPVITRKQSSTVQTDSKLTPNMPETDTVE